MSKFVLLLSVEALNYIKEIGAWQQSSLSEVAFTVICQVVLHKCNNCYLDQSVQQMTFSVL